MNITHDAHATFTSDRDAIVHACRLAQARGEGIGHGTARAIAAGYDEPGAVHSFVTTGAIPNSDSAALWGALAWGGRLYDSGNADDRLTLDMLGTYLTTRAIAGNVDSVPGWHLLWVPGREV